ncbi:MAG: hypothetical protein LBK60_12345 [Verrucomicrobiales bacterium]|jgi:hypothetical protein|nr:hypothetical protein [Verrucomicrobiales bacterium]
MKHYLLYVIIIFISANNLFSDINIGQTLLNNDKIISSGEFSVTRNIKIEPTITTESELVEFQSELRKRLNKTVSSAISKTSNENKKNTELAIKEMAKTRAMELKNGVDNTANFTIKFSGTDNVKIISHSNKSRYDNFYYRSSGITYQYKPDNNIIIISQEKKWGNIGGPIYENWRFAGRGILNHLEDFNSKISVLTETDNELLIGFFSKKHKDNITFSLRKDLGYLWDKYIIEEEKMFFKKEGQFCDFQYISGILFPTKYIETETRNKKLRYTITDTLKDIILNKNYEITEFIPRGFPICNVQDNRFSPPFFYLAKGSLPSEEELIKMRTNETYLQNYNDLIRKLAR